MSNIQWEQRTPDQYVFHANGYEGVFERSGKLVYLALRGPNDMRNLLTGGYAEGSAFDDEEWKRGIPKFKARIEDVYRAQVGLPPL